MFNIFRDFYTNQPSLHVPPMYVGDEPDDGLVTIEDKMQAFER